MIKRLLLGLLLMWLAIAPAIANSCASGCDTTSTSSAHLSFDNKAQSQDPPGAPDCHDTQSTHDQDDTKVPDGGSMAVACFVAGAVLIPSSFVSELTISIDSEHDSFVLLPAVSFQGSPPIKPPQA